MYQPVLRDNLIKTLYRVRKAYRKPMTKVAESLIQQGLDAIDKEQICKTCVIEGNNKCDECCLVQNTGKGV